MIGRHLPKFLVVTSAALLVALSAAVAPASATTPGTIDTSYGSGGVTVVSGAVSGVTTVDATGRALVLGPTSPAGTSAQLTRLTPTGQVDLTFGSSGTFALPAAVFYTRLAIDHGGLIYVLGSNAATGGASTQFVVTRVTANGGTDTNFGTGGTATIAMPSGTPPFVSDAFAVRNDGDVVVSVATNDAVKKGYLAALTPAGVLDANFGPMASPGIFQLPDKTFLFKLAAPPAPTAPAFVAATPPLTATVGTAYTYTFTATGVPAPTFTVSSGALPGGLSLNPTTGVLSGTPTASGPFTFTVKAANGVTPDAAAGPFTITVAPRPVAPVFTADSPPTAATVGTAYTYTFTASGQPAPTFAVASGALPPGLALNTTTGVVSGRPTGTGGAFTFTVKATNGVSPDAVSPSITIHVTAAPMFTAVSPPLGASVGTAYSYTFAASGTPAPTFSLASGSLPTGLSLSAAGVLSGTPSVAGMFTFQVKASNGVGADAVSSPITITVNQTPTAPTFTADTPPSTATVGVPYSYTFKANGFPSPTFSLLGVAPAGLTLNPTTGVLSGTPTTARTYVFRVKANNGVTPYALSNTIIITVSGPGAAAQAPAASTRAAAPSSEAATTAPPPDPNNDVVALLANDTGASRVYAVQRYTNTGTLDATFGTGGTTAAFPAGVVPSALIEAADSSYYVTGNDGQAVFLAHILSTGAFDGGFGTAGVLVGPVETCKPTGGLIMLGGGNVYVLAIDADSTCGGSPAIVLRFHNGALDTTFGAAGEVRVDSVAAMRVSGPNGGGLQPAGQVLVGLNGAAAPAAASAAVTRLNSTPAGPTIEAFTQLVDDSHFAAATVAPNPAGTYLSPLAAVVDGAGNTHAYAEGGNKHLFEIVETGSTWSAPVDLTAAVTSAPTITSAPKAVFDGTTIDVFALGATGDLIEYRNSGAMGAWTAIDVNTAAPAGSPQVSSALDPHSISGSVHMYAVTTAGHLVEVDNDNAGGHLWNFYDLTLSAGGGANILSGPAAVLVGTTPHVYTRAASNNHLLEYIADHAGGRVWNAYDTTAQTNNGPPIGATPIPTLIAGTPHIYTISAATDSTNGDLVEYVADHLFGRTWNAYDQTTGATGAPKPVGNPSVVLISGTPYGIGQPIPEVWETATGGDLTAIVADHQLGRVWNVYDATLLSGGPQLSGDPTPIVNGTTVQVLGLGKAAGAGAAAAAPAGSGLTTSGPSPSGFLGSLPN